MRVNEYQSLSQLQSKLTQKLGELDNVSNKFLDNTYDKKDFIDTSHSHNYDENDYKRVLDKLKLSDSKIREHEQSHASLGTTTSPISYNYQAGPDGKLYAVGGSVRLETSIPDDPKQASYKLDRIAKASSGVNDLSGADAQITIQANLNKLLISSKGEENAN